MNNLVLIQILSQDLNTLNIVPGQVIHCTDTNQTYYDNVNNYRIEITYATVYVKTEADKLAIPNPLINRIVIVLADKTINYFNGVEWNVLTSLTELQVIVESLNEYIPAVMEHDGKLLAPRTVADAVYTKAGFQVISEIDENKRLIENKVKNTYVQVREDGQKLFVIPFPIDNFDFQRDYMQVFANGNLCDPDFYTVIGDHLVLNNTVKLKAGQMVLFIFYYQTFLDQNLGVVLDTDNYADQSITTSKLSPSIRLNADNVVENVQRIFFTPSEKKKLAGVAEGATNFVMPETLPATMITQDPDHRFVTDVQIANWDGKANASDVYTKTETDNKIEEIIGSAPQALDTLKELAEALGNDPNFAGTITTELGEKATKAQLQALTNIVNNKTNINDYVRNGMWFTVTSVNQMSDSVLLEGRVTDPTFEAYIDCMEVVMKMDKTNKYGNVSLAINNLPAKPVLGQMGYPMAPGDLVENSIYTLRFNGTTGNFILQGKGGVNLQDTQLESFMTVDTEAINRGELIDILPDNTVATSIVRPFTLTTHETSLADYNCDTDLKVIPLDKDRFLMIWLNGQILKMQVIFITNNFIDIAKSRLQLPVVVNSNCAGFRIENVAGNIGLVYYSVSNEVTIKQVFINDSTQQITFGTAYFVDEEELVENVHLIPMVSTGTAICVYEHGKVTKGIYFSFNTANKTLNMIRVRDNLGYALNSYALASDNQIIFASSVGDSINAWVMSLTTTDFELSNQVTIVTNNQYTFTDPVMTTLKNNQIVSTWTTSTKAKVYRQFIQLDFKGGIVYGEPVIFVNDSYRVSSNLFPKQTYIQDNFYVCPSANNYDIPSLDEQGKQALKITTMNINIEADSFDVVYTDTPIYGRNPVKITYGMYGRDKMLVAYTAKNPITSDGQPDPLHIYFVVSEVRKLPFGVAMTNAEASQILKTSIW